MTSATACNGANASVCAFSTPKETGVLSVLNRAKFTKSQRLVLRFFRTHPDWDGGTRPLAALLGLSRATVQTAINRLADCGELAIDAGNPRRANAYRITAAKTVEKVPVVGGPILGQVAQFQATPVPLVGGPILGQVAQFQATQNSMESMAFNGPPRAFTHSLTNKETVSVSVSECSFADAAAAEIGLTIRPGDQIRLSYENLPEELAMNPREVLRAIRDKVKAKRAAGYPIRSAGAVLEWIRADYGHRRHGVPVKPSASAVQQTFMPAAADEGPAILPEFAEVFHEHPSVRAAAAGRGLR